MLSDEQLLRIHNDAANSEPLYDGPDLEAELNRYSLRGLRAVEAAVRADQIEKDAAIARKSRTAAFSTTPRGYSGNTYAKDLRSAEIEGAIRAQLTEGDEHE